MTTATRLTELLDRLWRARNELMTWGRIPSDHVMGGGAPEVFARNDDYIVVRLRSMFIKNGRLLWLKQSPLAHAMIELDGGIKPTSLTAVVGPAQFGDLATAPANRSVIINQRLAGPIVWRGGDLRLAVGLFSVSKDQAAIALLDTLGQLAALGTSGLKLGTEIAGILKSGVEGVLGLKGTTPLLGVKDALPPAGSAFEPCVLVAIATPRTEIEFDRLWLAEGSILKIGNDPGSLGVFTESDYLVVGIERGSPREDWRGMPAFLPHEEAFDAAIRDKTLDRPALEARLNEAFIAFDDSLSTASELTDTDKDRVRGEVMQGLRERADRRFGQHPFPQQERRSAFGVEVKTDYGKFDFADIGGGRPEASTPAPSGSVLFPAAPS